MADTEVIAEPISGNDVKVNQKDPRNNNADTTQNGDARQKRSRDDLVPASKLWTTKIDEGVLLRQDEKETDSVPPRTMMTIFENVVNRVPTHTALAVKRSSAEWTTWTFSQYHSEVITAAKAFIKLGLEPYHGVGILGFNSPEWFFADLGAIYAGGLAVGIYATNTPEACEYVLKDSQSNICVVENNAQLQKILKVWGNLPHLKAIVQYTGEVAERRDNVFSWKEFMSFAQDTPAALLKERIDAQAPNKACTLVYTSGTTGNPKGVMLSHDNFNWILVKAAPTYDFKFGQGVSVSYLPLSHVAGQIMDIHGAIYNGFTVYFARPDALKGTLKDTLLEVRPTFFMGVPRVWEKFMEKIVEKGRETRGLKRKFAIWAKKKGLQGTYRTMNHQPKPRGWNLANKLFGRVKKQLGLDRCNLFVTAAAPITKETVEFFYSLNMPLFSVYGMSENSGPHTSDVYKDFRIGSVGKDIVGTKTKIADVQEDGSGEVCMWGRHVFMGYLNNEEKTLEAIDSDGWLRSGDLGKKDSNGFLYITGRIKELLITAGGENVAPVPIEDAVKEELPVISNCMLIGDKRKFLSLLIALKTVLNVETGEPSEQLLPEAIDWCRSVGCNATTVSNILDTNDPKVFKAIQEGIDRANEKAVSRAAKIQKWSILPRDFSIFGGELGPTMKLRRPIVVKMYEKTIDAFYAES